MEPLEGLSEGGGSKFPGILGSQTRLDVCPWEMMLWLQQGVPGGDGQGLSPAAPGDSFKGSHMAPSLPKAELSTESFHSYRLVEFQTFFFVFLFPPNLVQPP